MKIIIMKKKTLFTIIAIILLVVVALSISATYASKQTASPIDAKVIVLDAGHGGVDKGVVSKNGTKESEFNLKMTFLVRDMLKEAGFKVVLTRENEEGLYGDATKHRKRADMVARKKIIQKNNPDIIISIHANKYPSGDRRGAQVFFDEYNEKGKILAKNIQANVNLLNKEYVNRDFSALSGDYFLLKCSKAPSVIMECGFLSNQEDEKLLADNAYCQRMAFCIYGGIVSFFENEK
ncbi:MAG TPA: N-acetylmuramoyl-L-alanine amidase [Clostridia bacterium]|nr:N-acetylmuramoyl-L-alanine amidase [Clostridia bacterium]